MITSKPSLWLRLIRGVAVVLLAAIALTTLPVLSSGDSQGSRTVSISQLAIVNVVHAENDASDLADMARESRSASDEDCGFLCRLIKDGMYSLIQFFGWMTLTLFKVLEIVATYNGFTTEPIVVKGWTIVRDICNMFFIFAMLLIAFGTILRIQAYHYRSLLFKVVLMAILMNLSKSIVGVLIDLSQIVMLSFVSGFKHMVAGSLAQALGIDKVLGLQPTQTDITGVGGAVGSVNDGAIASAGTVLSSFILAALIMGLIFITVLAITVQLIVRLIKLWILTIMAPIAFAGTLFKGLGSMASKWWDELTKELVAGPTLMFFLWLVLAISSANSGEVFGTGNESSFNPLNLPAASANNLVNLFVVVGLLWAGLAAAKAGGTAAAGAVGFGLGKLTSVGKGTARLAGKGAVGTGRWAGKWAREAGSRTGINTALATAGEGLKETGVGKTVRFFTPTQIKKRWELRDQRRKEREVTQMSGIETAASNLGMEKTTSWVQAAKQKRGARYKAESNKKVAERQKELNEQGYTDDATIYSALDSNMSKDGKVVDELQQKALLYQLQKYGVKNKKKADDDIIKYTEGMTDVNATRISMKGVFKDSDTTRINADGSVRTRDEVQKAVSEDLKNDTRDGDKTKRFERIDDRVEATKDGRVADETAEAMLLSDSFDDQYYAKLGKRQENVDRAYSIAWVNTTDEAARQKLLNKYNQVTRRDPAVQQAALAAAESDKERAKLEKKFSTLHPVTLDANGFVNDNNNQKLGQEQAKAFVKMQNKGDKEARNLRGQNKPRTEEQKVFADVLSTVKDSTASDTDSSELKRAIVEKKKGKGYDEFSSTDEINKEEDLLDKNLLQPKKLIDLIRTNLAELSTVDRAAEKDKWQRTVNVIKTAEAALVEGVNGSLKASKKKYMDARGNEMSAATMVQQQLGGSYGAELDNLSKMAERGTVTDGDLQQRAASMNSGLAARYGTAVLPNVQPIGAIGKKIGWKRDQADVAAFIPGMAKRYVTPTQRVERVVEGGGRNFYSGDNLKFGQKFEGVSDIRGQMEAAYKKVEAEEREKALKPVVTQINALLLRLRDVKGLDKVQDVEINNIKNDLENAMTVKDTAGKYLGPKPIVELNREEISNILSRIQKLGNLA